MSAGPLQDGPDWRYTVATVDLERLKARKPLFYTVDDPGVESLRRFLNMWFGPLDRDLVRSMCRPLTMAYEIYTDPSPDATRNYIEAIVLAGGDNNAIRARTGKYLEDRVLSLYRYLFFDVSDRLTNRHWCERTILSKYQGCTEKRRLLTCYIWKLVAMNGGLEMLDSLMLSGADLNETVRRKIRSMALGRYAVQVLNAIHSSDKVLDEAGTPASAPVRAWEADDGRKDSDGALGEAATTEHAQAIMHALRVMQPGEENEAIERIDYMRSST
jgi:hypothetical protein